MPDPPSPPENAPSRGGTGSGLRTAAWILWLAAGVLGVGLRVWHLGEQVVAGDEFHGMRASVDHDAGYLASHNVLPDYEDSDYSVPLALLHRGLRLSVGLDEWSLRLPVLCSGLFLLVLFAALAWRSAGPGAALCATWLAAISPLLVLYSRFARPYALVVLGATLALYAWMRWSQNGARRWLWCAAIAGALAIYANLTAAPAVLCIWGWGVFARPHGHARGQARTGWRHAALGGVLLTLAALFPLWRSLADFAGDKSGAPRADLGAWWSSAEVLFGAPDRALVVTFLLASLWGCVICLRRRALGSRLMLAMFLAACLALLLSAPKGANHPTVLARYLLGAWPGVLLFASVGLLSLGRTLAAATRASATPAAVVSATPAALLIVWSLLAGPLPALYRAPNGFTNHRFHYARSEWSFRPELASPFYRTLAERPDPQPIVEIPWTLEWSLTPYGYYQAIHGKPVRLDSAFVDDFRAPGMRFRTIVPWRKERPDYRGFDTLVVHRDIVAEAFHVTGRNEGEWPAALSKTRWGYQSDAKILLRSLRADDHFRETYQDEWVVVMERVDRR